MCVHICVCFCQGVCVSVRDVCECVFTGRERDETEKGKDEWVEEGETKIELPTQGSPIILLWLIFFSFE